MIDLIDKNRDREQIEKLQNISTRNECGNLILKRNVEKKFEKEEFVCEFLANYRDDQKQSAPSLSQTVHPPKP